jgi:hypothetical protein|tara:strand:+ start:316 stop:525 length:210 start_codon:yes stop_codon:yes gene_type:complete
MSIATNAQASKIMQNVEKGTYLRGSKFHDFGSVPEDSIYYHTMLAQKADKERAERIAQSKIRLRQKGLA